MTQAEVFDRQMCKYYSWHIILVSTPHNVKFRHNSYVCILRLCIVQCNITMQYTRTECAVSKLTV